MAAVGASSFNYPQTVEEVFKDYKGRHDAVMKALTTDLDDFFRQCAPDKENLCLFGSPSGSWEVNLPPECVPPEFPEPTVGINFRDGLEKHQWLYLVACHTDAWLLSVAFFFGSNVGLKKTHRKRLFNMINDLPTISEVVLENINTEKETKVTNPSSNDNSNSNAKRVKVDHDEAKEEYSDSLCGVCRKNDDEFWICCDTCNTWYHGRCVNITPEQAEHIDQYECPTCRSTKRPQP